MLVSLSLFSILVLCRCLLCFPISCHVLFYQSHSLWFPCDMPSLSFECLLNSLAIELFSSWQELESQQELSILSRLSTLYVLPWRGFYRRDNKTRHRKSTTKRETMYVIIIIFSHCMSFILNRLLQNSKAYFVSRLLCQFCDVSLCHCNAENTIMMMITTKPIRSSLVGFNFALGTFDATCSANSLGSLF